MNAQEEKELLLRVVTKLIVKQLEAQEGFFPFGATLGTNRNIQLLMPEDVKRDVTEEEVHDYWVEELRQAVASAECRAVCYCCDVRIPSKKGALVPAILTYLEHVESASGRVFFKYHIDEATKTVVLDESITEPAQKSIFPASSPTLT